MAYIGQTPQVGNFVKIDDISSQFDGTTNQFTTEVSDIPYTISNKYASLVVADGNVLQPEVDYNFQNATITFATAPTSAWLNKFWIIAYGDVLDTGIPSDGTVSNDKITNGTLQYAKLSAVLKARLLANSIIFGA
jgi:hypothetical protein